MPGTGPSPQSAFWVRVANQDFRFQIVAEDWDGQRCDFAIPLIFIGLENVPGYKFDLAFDKDVMADVVGHYNEAKASRQRALKRSATLNLAVAQKREDELSVYAGDLIRGYRPDVWDSASGQWQSLCRRVGEYKFTKSGLKLTLADEGWVSTAATEAPDGSSDLRVHEVLFRWEGWSLCAPRPGKAVESEESAAPQPALGLDAGLVPAKGSLPRLRFGNEYRLRARAVDLAGNSLSLEEADDSAATDPLAYLRHEPLAGPVLVPPPTT